MEDVNGGEERSRSEERGDTAEEDGFFLRNNADGATKQKGGGARALLENYETNSAGRGATVSQTSFVEMEKSLISYDEGRCRIGWYPRFLAFFITSAVGLSVMSSLDCKFFAVDLDFVPYKYYEDQLGFGLWAFEAPDGRCLSYSESHVLGGFSDGDTIYSNILINNDLKWTISRVLAIAAAIFGVVGLISIWINVCKPEPHLVDIITYATITAFMCECAKFGIFLMTDLCQSPNYWYNSESEQFSGSKGCEMDRGAFLSISSAAAYFLPMLVLLSYAARPKKVEDYAYDESSLPSFLADEKENKTEGKSGLVKSFTRKESSIDPNMASSVSINGPDPNRRRTTSSSAYSRQPSVQGSDRGPLTRRPSVQGSMQGSMVRRQSMARRTSTAPIMEDYGMEQVDEYGMPMDGMPMDGMQINGMPMDGMQINGMPMDGMQINGMPMDGMPINGMPMDGMQEEYYGNMAMEENYGMMDENYGMENIPFAEEEMGMDPMQGYPPPPPPPPPPYEARRRNDDCSTLTWDPGY